MIMPFDELNRLEERLPEYFDDSGHIKSKKAKDDLIDEMFDFFLLAYSMGVVDTNDTLGSEFIPSSVDAEKTINRKIAGKTWQDRVNDYFESGGTVADITRIIETEAHRDGNEAAYKTAKAVGATEKVWHCMMLTTSRETHLYLDGVSAPIDGEFYSFKGGSTLFPGQWGIAEEDVNCLCWLSYQR